MAKWSCKERAIHLLARRDHSRYELKMKLQRHHEDVAEIEATLSLLEAKNLIKDSQMAMLYIQSRAAKGIGPLKITQELKLKGLSSAIIQGSMKCCNIDWLVVLKTLYIKKYSDKTFFSTEEKFKAMRFLMSRGFSAEMVKHCLESFF